LSTYANINKSNTALDKLAGISKKSTANLADLADGGTIRQDSKEPLKNNAFNTLNLFTIGLFGITRRKAKKEFKNNTGYNNYFASEILGSCKNRKYADLYIGNPKKSLQELKLFIRGISKKAIKSRYGA
jgi:hypothetical protein